MADAMTEVTRRLLAMTGLAQRLTIAVEVVNAAVDQGDDVIHFARWTQSACLVAQLAQRVGTQEASAALLQLAPALSGDHGTSLTPWSITNVDSVVLNLSE